MLIWIVTGVALTYVVSWIWLFGFGLREQPQSPSAPSVSQDHAIQWSYNFSAETRESAGRADDRRVATPV